MDTEERILSRKFLVCEVRTSRQPQPGQRGLDFGTSLVFQTGDPKLGEDESESLAVVVMSYFGRLRILSERTGTLKYSIPGTGTVARRCASLPPGSVRFCGIGVATTLPALAARRVSLLTSSLTSLGPHQIHRHSTCRQGMGRAYTESSAPILSLIFYTMQAEVVHFQGIAFLKTA